MLNNEIYKSCKEIPNVLVSDHGNIIYNNRVLHQEKLHGYRRVRINNKPILTHRLVAKTFIPNPDNKPQVNHIDGNKENNHVSNLEWVTAKENIAHALYTNLRKDRYPISIYDIKTNQTHEFKLLKDCSVFLGVSQDAILSKIKSSKRYPINNQYVLMVDDIFLDRIKHPLRNNNNLIYSYDHATNKITKYVSAAEAAYETGMNSYTIREACSKKHEVYYIGGYSFSYNRNAVFGKVNKFKALRDRLLIYKKPFLETNQLIDVYDYNLKKVITSGGCKELAKFFKIPSACVSDQATRALRSGKNVLLKGYGIMYRKQSLNTSWYPYSKKELIASIYGQRSSNIVFKITDLLTKQESYGAGIDELMLMYPNFTKNMIRNWIKHKQYENFNIFPGVQIEIL